MIPLPLNPLALALALCVPCAALAQVRTDGSLGPAAQSLSGPVYAIPESLGHRAGNNVFHSFQTFRIGVGEAALFSTTTPSIANVIGRVTGGEVSTINGAIRLEAAAGAPALYLVNPAGVVFGPGAAIDVPGAFHATTADAVRFPDGTFYASPSRLSSLSSAPPEAFGFLGAQRGAVVLQGTRLSSGDSPLSLVAGDVVLRDGGAIHNGAGGIAVAAVGNQSVDVPVSALARFPGALQGSVRIEAGSSLQTESTDLSNGGHIQLHAGRLDVSGGEKAPFTGIRAHASGVNRGGAVNVQVTEGLAVSQGASVGSTSEGAGAAGSVAVAAGALVIDAGTDTSYTTGIQSLATSAGAAGDVTVRVRGDARVTGPASIASEFVATGDGVHRGTAGGVQVTADQLVLEGHGSIRAAADAGTAGPITVAANTLTLSRGHVVSSADEAAAVSIAVDDRLRIQDGSNISTYSGGLVRVSARQIDMDKGRIESHAVRDADASGVQVAARDTLVMRNGSKIEVSSWGAAAAGTLDLSAGELMVDKSQIVSQASMSGRGADIRIAVARYAELRNGSTLSTGVTGNGEIEGSGVTSRGGDISLQAQSLLIDGSVIESTNDSAHGRGGDVALAVDGRLRITDDGSGVFSGIRSVQTDSLSDRASAGQIAIRAGDLALDGNFHLGWDAMVPDDLQHPWGTGIYARSSGARASAIGIDVRGDALLRRAFISSEGENGGDSGAVRLTAQGSVRLEDGQISTTTHSGYTGAHGRSGEITLQASDIQLTGWSTLNSEGTVSNGVGGAGTVRLTASGEIVLTGRSAVVAGVSVYGDEPGLADDAVSGRVEIEASRLVLDGRGADGSPRINSNTLFTTGRAQAVPGEIVVHVTGPVELYQGASISTNTGGHVDAGTIRLDAGRLVIDRDGSPFFTGLSSTASYTSMGNAGSIVVRLDGDLQLHGGGEIVTAAGRGAAGTVRIDAVHIEVSGQMRPSGDRGACDIWGCWEDGVVRSGILAMAPSGGTGETGHIALNATQGIVVADGAHIIIQNDATAEGASPARGTLSLTAPRIVVRGGGARLNAASTGNVEAGDIRVTASDLLLIQDGQITTSAVGLAGDGGNIRIVAPTVALDTGFIQANATAAGATGGHIVVDAGALLTSHQSLRVGGDRVASFASGVSGANVIQAVAPTGISGNIEIVSPQLDLAGTLTPVQAGVLAPGVLGKSPCQRTGGSSLALAGRGGLPPSPSAWLSAQAPAQAVDTAAWSVRPQGESTGGHATCAGS